MRRRAKKLFSQVEAVDEKERRKFKVGGLGIAIVLIARSMCSGGG